VSGAGKEDKPGKDYWKTGDPALRAKVISSVGVAIVVLSIMGFSSFESYNYYNPSQQQASQQLEEKKYTNEKRNTESQPSEDKSNTEEQPPAPPSTGPPADMTPLADISTTIPVTLFLLFILGIILAIVGFVSYLRRRKKAIH
jgi:hypothetical protein